MNWTGTKTFTDGARALRSSPPRIRPTSAGSLPPLTAGIVALTVVGIAALVAVSQPSTRDDPETERWYDNLDKSVATPPDAVFGVVWPLIEAASAYAGFRLLTRRSGVKRNSALGFLGFNLALIPAFTKLFFGDRNLRGATLSSMSLFAGAWGFVLTAWRADRQAALAGLPLAAWVTFANYLQEEILRRNDPEVRQRAARMAGL